MNLLLSFFLLNSIIQINQSIPEGPFSYPGKNPREIIIVDPSNSPILQKACIDLKKSLEKDILFKTLQFVQENLFDSDYCTADHVHQLITEVGNGQLQPEIPLEAFLAEKVGVCRHIALTTTYLLNSLVKEGMLEGKALLIREETPFGRHAWTLFLTEKDAWHLDAYWGVLENGKTSAGFSKLCKKYGKTTMERQQTYWENDAP